MTRARRASAERGIALLAVLFALVLLMMLALPFAVSMGVGASAAARELERTTAAQSAASARDLLLAEAALSTPGIDQTPTFDSLDEFPDHVEVPKAFEPLLRDGRVLLGGEVTDLQRRIGLDGVSPLLLANLLGVTTWLAEPLDKEARSLKLETADALPDAGFVWVGHELIHYGSKQGNQLLDCERGMQQELGYLEPVEHGERALVLDYRCILAAAWPFLGRGERAAGQRLPFHGTGELAEIVDAGAGVFTAEELETFERTLSPNTQAATAATWGRPERVFDAMVAGKSRSLRVRSALHVGAGSTVRLRNLRSGAVEYGLVMTTATERGASDLLLPAVFRLALLQPVGQDFPPIDTVVEPLIPAPVNLNTASEEVLTALFAGVRRAPAAEVHGANGGRTANPSPIAVGIARELAGEIVARRAGDGRVAGQGPFTGWRDVAERLWKPRLDAATGPQKSMWLDLYRNLETGRDSTIEMGTAPLCFTSGPWVSYRAAAAESRSVVAPGVTARQERTGLAAALPGFRLEHAWTTQEVLEEAFRLDRRAPGWTTLPVNLGGLQGDTLGNDPAARFFPHVVPLAYPGIGLGEPRYAATDEADSGLRPATATAPADSWGLRELRQFDAMAAALDPRGHDVARDGPYLMTNTGPTGDGKVAAKPARHGHVSFEFTTANGGAGRFATSFWAEPKTLDGTTLFDYGVGDPDHNRIALHGRDGQLVFEVLDEAGLDPDYAKSPAGLERTASEWSLPLAELALPPDTPVHVALSAFGSRPTELSLAVDGVTRGKPKYATYLTAAVPVYDPTRNVASAPGQFNGDRYLNVQVESTAGFPPVGILRIGTELFEYSAIAGNSFQCQYKDSVGQRGARQAPAEMRPAIPVDANGQPSVDIGDLNQQGINLDVFPEHPVGSLVELYGYSALLSEDSPMQPGVTQLSGAIGAFAVARGFVTNPTLISVSVPTTGQSFPVGRGLDASTSGELQLAAPVPTGTTYPPAAAAAEITDAFPATGGYALLVQRLIFFQTDTPGATTTGTTAVGGVEVIRYTSRQGNKLNGVQRGQRLPGNDALIRSDQYDGTARPFVTDWPDGWQWGNTQSKWDDVPTLILWVVPISLPVADPSAVWDPDVTKLTEWLQLLPKSGSQDDIEWVRYDTLTGNQVVRANRAAWDRLRYELTNTNVVDTVRVGPLGAGSSPTGVVTAPWGTVVPTSGYIGYTPRLESTYPQIQSARRALGFRGDPFTGTSSHAHPNSTVMQCQRLQLNWGNWGAFTGRTGRHDRVALIGGSRATGQTRPVVEWHTVTWTARRYNSDNLQKDRTPPELFGPWPFQLVAFADGVRGQFLGPPRDTAVTDVRQYDRLVKFPSGELPAAYCGEVAVGAGVGNQQPMRGFVDELEVVQHPLLDMVVEDAFAADARVFRVDRGLAFAGGPPLYLGVDPSAALPPGGGLLTIDGEILAYQSRADGEITIAQNGRGLLNTEARGHDRGARVHFLTHRPAAILAGAVGNREEKLPVQAVGALPRNGGLLLLGRELLHYTWIRAQGDQVTLEMPRWLPPGDDEHSPQARGLFRGAFGTTVQTGSSGEAVIAFPFRFWDRHRERSDDPELAYFQLTTNEAPQWFESVRWRQETAYARVQVVCLVRTDGRAPWSAEPQQTPGLWRFVGSGDDGAPHRIAAQAARLEVRFAVAYQPGVIDLASFAAHGWKTSVRVRDVRVDYDGQGCIFDERVTER